MARPPDWSCRRIGSAILITALNSCSRTPPKVDFIQGERNAEQRYQFWQGHFYRTTRDIDFLGKGSPDLERIKKIFVHLCDNNTIETDGLVSEPAFLRESSTRKIPALLGAGKITGKHRNSTFACDRYIGILNEGTDVLDIT